MRITLPSARTKHSQQAWGLARCLGLAAVGVGVAAPVQAAVIDFESVPGGTPSDQLAINSQYQASQGVSFRLSTGGEPHLEAAGGSDPGNGFLNDALGQHDVADTGLEDRLGDFFLRLGTGGLQSKPVASLVIDYETAVNAASGEIWDIDGHNQGDEQWRVEAVNTSDTVIDTLMSPRGTDNGPDSLDGEPWVWSFNHASDDILGIRISFVDDANTKADGIGLAFDNFSPTQAAPSVPAPATLALLVLGLVGFGLTRRSPRH